jgi:hypothetical protein
VSLGAAHTSPPRQWPTPGALQRERNRHRPACLLRAACCERASARAIGSAAAVRRGPQSDAITPAGCAALTQPVVCCAAAKGPAAVQQLFAACLRLLSPALRRLALVSVRHSTSQWAEQRNARGHGPARSPCCQSSWHGSPLAPLAPRTRACACSAV